MTHTFETSTSFVFTADHKMILIEKGWLNIFIQESRQVAFIATPACGQGQLVIVFTPDFKNLFNMRPKIGLVNPSILTLKMFK